MEEDYFTDLLLIYRLSKEQIKCKHDGIFVEWMAFVKKCQVFPHFCC